MTGDAVLIAGPTASGKSAAALELARAIGGVVINADSMQVYAEAPLLTAQPGAADQARAPHLLYGHIPARRLYSVGRYAEDAAAALAQARAENSIPIFTGGTGLYFMALTDGLSEIPPVPDDVRDDARALLEKIGVEAMHEKLASQDPQTASRLRPTDPQRVLRAYEVFAATSTPLATWQGKTGQPVLAGLKLAKFLIDPPRDILRARIAARFEAMLDSGALDEARALANLDPALPAAKLLGLRPLMALARGEISRDEAVTQAVTATGQFAKRQSTWFRGRMSDYARFDSLQSNIITIYSQFTA